MGLFGFGKKKEEPACACGADVNNIIEDARIIVLGACCKKSSETFENVKTAVAELGLNEAVSNDGRMEVVASYGVMQTPALVVDKKVLSYGNLITVEKAKELITQAING